MGFATGSLPFLFLLTQVDSASLLYCDVLYINRGFKRGVGARFHARSKDVPCRQGFHLVNMILGVIEYFKNFPIFE